MPQDEKETLGGDSDWLITFPPDALSESRSTMFTLGTPGKTSFALLVTTMELKKYDVSVRVRVAPLPLTVSTPVTELYVMPDPAGTFAVGVNPPTGQAMMSRRATGGVPDDFVPVTTPPVPKVRAPTARASPFTSVCAT